MKTAPWIRIALAIIALSFPAAAQEAPGWTETRFHRVYLNNGNFIDGYLVQESDNTLTFKIVGGEIGIRKDFIQRSDGKLRIELVKMRSYKEPPKLETTHPLKTAETAPTAVKSDPATPKSDAPAEEVSLKGTVDEMINQARAMLSEGVPARRKGAIDALVKIGPPSAALLAEVFPTMDDSLVPTIAGALQMFKEASVLPRMVSILANERSVVRGQAALVVGTLGSAKEEGHRVRDLLEDADPQVRAAAMSALRMLGDLDSFGRIAEFLASPDKDLRLKAITTLRDLAEKGGLTDKFAAALSRAIFEADDEGRKELTEEAAKLGSKDLGPVLTRLCVDRDPMVRAFAIMGIGRINSKEYASLILDRMDAEREYWPRIQLAGAVQVMRIDGGIDKLIDWLGDTDANVRAAALRALRGITGMNFGGDRDSWYNWRDKTRRR